MALPNDHITNIGIAYCTPIPKIIERGRRRTSPITVEWHRKRVGLIHPTNTRSFEVVCDGYEVGQARNLAVLNAIKSEAEFLFFLDYDVLPEFDAVQKLVYRARSFPDYHVFSGVYCTKNPKVQEPLIYMENGGGSYWDWTLGDLLFDVGSVGMGCCLIRTSIFQEGKLEEPYFLTEKWARINKDTGVRETFWGTEDIYFCTKIREAGYKIMVDTSVLCGHQDISTGVVYGLGKDSPPVKRAHWIDGIVNGKVDSAEDEDGSEIKYALDMGAGESRREWDGYVTKTLDIRPEAKPDYVQDSVYMNLPDDTFDLVASSHHLEHIPRFHQEKVWDEIFRVLKPGGKVEHIVPNVQWAAQHIVNGHVDEHVFNVLYGAQEAHGYKREYNLHYFGYEPMVARALAEGCGLVNVVITTYRKDESLGYNMIITGEKPGGPNNVQQKPKESKTGTRRTKKTFIPGNGGNKRMARTSSKATTVRAGTKTKAVAKKAAKKKVAKKKAATKNGRAKKA